MADYAEQLRTKINALGIGVTNAYVNTLLNEAVEEIEARRELLMDGDKNPKAPGYGRCPECNEVFVNSKYLLGQAFCGAEEPPHGLIVEGFPEIRLHALRTGVELPRARIACGDYRLKAFRIEGQGGVWRRVKKTFVVSCVTAWHDGPGFEKSFPDKTGISTFVPYAPQDIIEADRDKLAKGG